MLSIWVFVIAMNEEGLTQIYIRQSACQAKGNNAKQVEVWSHYNVPQECGSFKSHGLWFEIVWV